jgi:DNA-directed RNA polymerase specialized sigma subunit
MIADHAEHAATTERLMRVLTDHEREILRPHFGEDLYQAEIAERVGVSATQVARSPARSDHATGPSSGWSSHARRAV